MDFLAAREERKAAARRLGESMAKLDALNLPPLTDDEVEAVVQESRSANSPAVERAVAPVMSTGKRTKAAVR